MGEIRRDRGTGMAPRWRPKEQRWESRYVDASGKRRSIYVRRPGRAGERECERRLAEAISLAAAGIRPTEYTLAAYAARWVERHARLTVGSRQRYADLVRLHVRGTEQGGIAVIRLQPEDLEDLYRDRLLSGCAPKSVELIHTILRGALRTAAERGHALRNVATLVSPPPVPKSRRDALTAVECVRLLDGVAGDRLEALWTLALQVPIREGELLGLRWADVDVDRARLALRDPEKDGVPRTLRLAARSVRALRAHRAKQAEERLASGGAYELTDLVFADLRGERLDPRRVREAFHRARDRAGLRRVRFHDLRHAAATYYLESGLPLKVVQEILGHRDSRTTIEVYGHVTETMQEQAVGLMDRLFGT